MARKSLTRISLAAFAVTAAAIYCLSTSIVPKMIHPGLVFLRHIPRVMEPFEFIVCRQELGRVMRIVGSVVALLAAFTAYWQLGLSNKMPA